MFAFVAHTYHRWFCSGAIFGFLKSASTLTSASLPEDRDPCWKRFMWALLQFIEGYVSHSLYLFLFVFDDRILSICTFAFAVAFVHGRRPLGVVPFFLKTTRKELRRSPLAARRSHVRSKYSVSKDKLETARDLTLNVANMNLYLHWSTATNAFKQTN